LAKATVIPVAVLVYLGRIPELIVKVSVKLPAAATPKRNIRITLITILSIKRIPRSKKKEIIKLKNKSLFFLKCCINLFLSSFILYTMV